MKPWVKWYSVKGNKASLPKSTREMLEDLLESGGTLSLKLAAQLLALDEIVPQLQIKLEIVNSSTVAAEWIKVSRNSSVEKLNKILSYWLEQLNSNSDEALKTLGKYNIQLAPKSSGSGNSHQQINTTSDQDLYSGFKSVSFNG